MAMGLAGGEATGQNTEACWVLLAGDCRSSRVAHPTTTALLPLAFLWPLGRTDGGPRPAAGSSAPERTHARWVVLAKCKFFSFFGLLGCWLWVMTGGLFFVGHVTRRELYVQRGCPS